MFSTRHEVAKLEQTVEELRAALERGWQRRSALEDEIESLRSEIARLREAAPQAPFALAAEREELRRQIDDLLGVKALVAEQLASALQRLHAAGDEELRPSLDGNGRVHADPASLDHVVEPRVQIEVAPLLDFAGLSALERALAAVPQVADTRIRRIDGERAFVDLELREPGPLLRWLDGALPFDVDVAAIDGATVALAVR